MSDPPPGERLLWQSATSRKAHGQRRENFSSSSIPRPLRGGGREARAGCRSAQSQITFASRGSPERGGTSRRTQASIAKVIDQRRQPCRRGGCTSHGEGALSAPSRCASYAGPSPMEKHSRSGRKLVTEGISSAAAITATMRPQWFHDPIYSTSISTSKPNLRKHGRLAAQLFPRRKTKATSTRVQVALPAATDFPRGTHGLDRKELDPGNGNLRGRRLLPKTAAAFSPGQLGRVSGWEALRTRPCASRTPAIVSLFVFGSDQSRRSCMRRPRQRWSKWRGQARRLSEGCGCAPRAQADETVVISGMQRFRRAAVSPTRKQIAEDRRRRRQR